MSCRRNTRANSVNSQESMMTHSGKFGMYVSLDRPFGWLIVNIMAHALEVQKHRWNVDKD